VQVTLREITIDNWQECIKLRVSDEQTDLVPSNIYSIAEAQFYPEAVPLPIYDGQERMVGFVMYGVDVASDKWKIFRLMIDQAYQGRGYGRAAMRHIIERLAAQPDCGEILISYQPSNNVARQLYADLGFIEQEISDEKVTACLRMVE
jgi:diamine N-acetyltransferase